MPVNKGDHSVELFMMENLLNFYLHFFNFWPNLVCTILAQVSIVVANSLLYLEPVTGIMIVLALGGIAWSFFNFLVTYLIITQIGLNYVQSETVNIGNEQLLNNLKEGIIILDKDTGFVRFLNNAAKVFKIELGKNFSMQLDDD